MWSSKLSVHPWIGKNYETPSNFKNKILVLGESNFTEVEKFKKNLVIDCVLDDISTERPEERDTTGFCRFSTKLRRIIFGTDTNISPNEFWQDVAFYNFVQVLVGDKARIRPTREMWEISAPAFFEVIQMLKPSRVLVLGKANWDNLLDHFEHENTDKFSATLKLGTDDLTVGYINHPSSSLRYQTWQPIAQKLLQL